MRRRGHDISLLEMIRRYSQPIRHRRRLWVMTLNHELEAASRLASAVAAMGYPLPASVAADAGDGGRVGTWSS